MDLESLGMDTGVAAAVVEATNWVKDCLQSTGLEKYLGRFYPALPFILGIGLRYALSGDWSLALKDRFQTGLVASLMWHGFRVSVKGK